MTELLITLMNAPRAVQRSVALGLLAVVIAIIVVIIGSLASILSSKIGNIEEMRAELFRLDEIIARRPSADVQFSNGGAGSTGLFIEGDSLPVIQAKLQERINTVASATGATVASISGTPQIEIDGATYIGVRADLEGSLQAFHDVVRQLETSEPPLIIRQASIHSTNMLVQGVLSEPLQLAGQIMIYGAIDPAIILPENGRP
ncbi:type II secretion system protein GspM [Neorhizobium sp. Rsf11]|uniref:Type II secretion system protein GspM n=2 Tax=Neorhizobium TaxID=1525371 RepID=A0ABV0MDG7_9HYPH|nr:type II secretion system protein GspM [Neorhizobium petrolearium]MCC2613768.1 type II secretion system protein M [Neorhizobium petrolearium]WGI72078.1 type II secretion system protein GspM [Neorhizobium petrolearium]